ncbi:uncharacterized protein EI90DRAFT_3156188 [Cantharellus anzutake]|uniref:uncharacterized protein n=1 Tax=Cantharellus anzutake TaxID=1750568 RepID=UPI0019076DFA|nr:uncharacterized protein EI90DRAFT_3156188 [Cantharellus anzutake]KAF8327422.1 hypothetical protein EI90DRAFT_3156188 [Cantharellus anzutake]
MAFVRFCIDRTSNEVILTLIKVLGNLRRNLSFFLRLQEAYESANDSVALCRTLVSADSEIYTVDLARSVGSLVATLIDLGRLSECQAVAQGGSRPSDNIHLRFGSSAQKSFYHLGQHSEAVPVIEESVKLCREVVPIHPTHKLELARVLRNYCISLNRSRRHSEELPVIEESMKLSRELVAVDPSHGPDLARGLRILRASLSSLEQHSDALPVVEDCRSYTPDLAQALWELSESLSKLGRRSEALPAIKESVNLWRKLVVDHLASYTQDLALALRHLSVSLDSLERYSEVLPVIDESVKLWRELVIVHPTTYTPDWLERYGIVLYHSAKSGGILTRS